MHVQETSHSDAINGMPVASQLACVAHGDAQSIRATFA
jgi:hypothetical protein